VLSLRAAEELGDWCLKGGYKLNDISHKNLFCSFGHGFDMDSSCFQHLFALFNIFSLFFVFPLKLSLRTADSNLRHLRGQDKPNPKGIFIKCRYSDTKRFFSLKPSAPKNKLSQTEACLSLRAAEKDFDMLSIPFRSSLVFFVFGFRAARYFTNRIQREF
jgi:hypothetical protein